MNITKKEYRILLYVIVANNRRFFAVENTDEYFLCESLTYKELLRKNKQLSDSFGISYIYTPTEKGLKLAAKIKNSGSV